MRQRAQRLLATKYFAQGAMAFMHQQCIHLQRAKCAMIEAKNIPKASSSLHVAKHKVVKPDEFTIKYS